MGRKAFRLLHVPHCELWPTEIENILKGCSGVGGLDISELKMMRLTTSAKRQPAMGYNIVCTNFDEFLEEFRRRLSAVVNEAAT